MSTKSELQSAIDTVLANGQTMPISQLRGLLKDNDVNLLDNIYADYGSDNETFQNFITLGLDGSYKYNLLWCKQGRKVYVTMRIYDIVDSFSLLGNLNIFETLPSTFSYSGLLGKPSNYSVAHTVKADGTIAQTLVELRSGGANPGQIFIKPPSEVGSELYVTLFYNTQN